MLLKKILKKSGNNFENEKFYCEIIDSHYKNLECGLKFCNRFSDIKKVIRFYACYLAFLKRNRESNLEFIMTLLHDIKNPMISVDYALRAKRNEDNLLENVYRVNKSLLNLIEDLLKDYKFDLNIQKLNIQEINLEEILEEEIEYYKYLLTEKNMKITRKFEANSYLFSDKNAIHRLFSNLLANAINHSNRNSQIEVEIFKKDKNICFSIKNEYSGSKFREDIFKKNNFKQEEFGLGLYIVKKILKKISGKIKIENTRNSLKFIIFLPTNLNRKR